MQVPCLLLPLGKRSPTLRFLASLQPRRWCGRLGFGGPLNNSTGRHGNRTAELALLKRISTWAPGRDPRLNRFFQPSSPRRITKQKPAGALALTDPGIYTANWTTVLQRAPREIRQIWSLDCASNACRRHEHCSRGGHSRYVWKTSIQ